MAKEHKRLSRENVQGFLDKTSDTGVIEGEALKQVTKARKRGFAGTLAAGGATLAGKMAKGANTLGGTLVEGVRTEFEHSDFKVRVKSFGFGLLATVIVLATMVLTVDASAVDLIPYDFKLKHRFSDMPQSGSLIHLDLDDQTIANIGRFPWPRSRWAGYVRECKKAGARHTAFDIEFYQNQQEEVDASAFADFKQWGEFELPSKVGNNLDSFTLALQSRLDVANKALESFERGASDEERLRATNDLKRAMGAIKDDKNRVLATEIDTEIARKFDALAASVVVDHDGMFANAVAEAGNVILPMHFDKSSLVISRPDRPSVTRELFEKFEKYLDETYTTDLHRSGRDSVQEAFLGAKVRDEHDGREVVIDDELAALYRDQTYTDMRSLYLYRMVRKWYAKQSEQVLRDDMEAYANNWTEFVGTTFSDGKMFARIGGAYRSRGFAHEWVAQAAEQLQRFYSWTIITKGRKRGDTPWCYPISVIEGYDSKSYDPWAPISAASTHASTAGMFHYRDTGFMPSIFRLLHGAENSGFVSIEHDSDGTVRSIPLFVVYEETLSGERFVMPQLAFQTLMLETAAKLDSLEIVPGQYVEFSAVREIVEALQLDTPMDQAAWEKAAARSGEPEHMMLIRIRVDDRCMMRINWVGGNQPRFDDVFKHYPISRIIDVAVNQDDIDKNNSGLAEALESREYSFLDEVTYAGRDGVPQFYLQPPKLVVRQLISKMSTLSLEVRQEIREFVAGEIRNALAYRLKRLEAPERVAVSSLDEAARDAKLKEFEDSDKAEDAVLVGKYLLAFERELRRILGPKGEVDVNVPLVEVLRKGPAGPELAESIAKEFEGIDGSAIPDTTKLPIGIASFAAQDWVTPFRDVSKSLDKAKKLSDLQRARVALLTFDASMAVAKRGTAFEEAAAEIEVIMASAYGAPVDRVAEEFVKELSDFRGRGPGKLITCGRAFRKLMWRIDVPYGMVELAEARKDSSSSLRGKAVRRLIWEIPLWVEAGMLSADSEIAVAVGQVVEHTWVKEGFASSTPIPADLAELSGKLLAFEEPLAAIIARRISSVNTQATESNARFKVALDRTSKEVSGYLSNRLALAGWAATGQGDVIVTSNSKAIPGPSLHSNTYNTILFSREPVLIIWWTIAISILVGAVVSLAAARFTVKWGIGSLVGCLVAFALIDNWVFSYTSHSFLTLTTMVPWLGAFLTIQVYRYAVEYRAKLKIKGQFGKFLSQEAVEELQKNPDLLKLGGDEKELCVMFSDIAGFTPISESMSASRLIDFLNDYMGRMCASIKDSKGYVDKFIGDAIMAIWGAPVPTPDYSARAVKTAVRNAQSLAAWNRERKERGELEVGARIGCATGPMVAGNMGTEWKLNYTCIGDTVNLGSRLEAANKQYGTQIMINELCYEQAKDVIVAHIMDKIAVKGKKKGLPVYHVVGLAGETEPKYIKGCELYTKGFELYQQEKWAEAIPFFKESKENLPPPYQVKEGPYDNMIERCDALVNATPEERMEILHLKTPQDEWDGVWKLTSK